MKAVVSNPSLGDTCPAPRLWREFLGQAAPREEDAGLLQHLDRCDSCQELLDRLMPLQTPACPQPAMEESALVRAKANLKADAASLVVAAPLETVPPTAPLGTLDHYQLHERLGQGGMGTVFLAWDQVLQRRVALKLLRPNLASLPKERQRFLSEARALAALRDDHVVTVHSVGEANDAARQPYLVMEYLEGGSVQHWLERAGRLPVPEVVSIGRQAALGLAAAHARKLLHKDVKPANLLLGQHRRVKLADFGLAQSLLADGTPAGLLAGTPCYMSPEQTRGEPLTPQSDLFNLGGTLYALLSGGPPFQSAESSALFRQIQHAEAKPLREQNPGVPPELVQIIAELLRKDPADRPSAAVAVAERLAQLEERLRQPTTALAVDEPAGTPTRGQPWARKVGSLLAGLVVCCFTFWLGFQAFHQKFDNAAIDPGKLFSTRSGLGKNLPSTNPATTLPAQLGYRWQGREQFPYEIRLTSDLPVGKYEIRGTLVYQPMGEAGPRRVLRVTGGLVSSLQAARPDPGQPFLPPPMHLAGGIITNGIGEPLITVDREGNLLEAALKEALPFGLGWARAAVLTPLTTRPEPTPVELNWRADLFQPPQRLGMAGMMHRPVFPGERDPNLVLYRGEESGSTQLLKLEGDWAELRRDFSIAARSSVAGIADVAVRGHCLVTFDTRAGVPALLHVDANASSESKGSRTTVPVKLSARLMSAEEYRAWLEKSAPQPKPSAPGQKEKETQP